MMYYSIIGLCLFKGIHADLPVHCLRHQVIGDWEFTMGPTSSTRSACGHQKPDSPDNQPALDFVLNQGQTTKRRITLQNPDTASTDDGSSGTFTMIYDEGFEVALGDTTFFAFSKFVFVGEGSNKHNVSKCHETQVGWYHDSTRSNWGCYFGKKVGTKDSGEQEAPRRKKNSLFSSSLDTDYAPTTDSSSISQVDSAMDSAFDAAPSSEQSTPSSNDRKPEESLASTDSFTTPISSRLDSFDGQQAVVASQDTPVPQSSTFDTPSDVNGNANANTDSFTFQSANALADKNKQDSLSLFGDKDTTLWSAPVPAPAPPSPPPQQQDPFTAPGASPMINSLDGDSWTWPAPVKKPEESLASTDSFTAPAPQDNTLTGEPLSLAIEDVPASYKPWVPSDDKRPGYDQPLTPEWHQSVVDGLNFLQLGWKAVHYQVYDNMSARQMNKFAGIRRKVPKTEKIASQAPAFLGLTSRTRRVKSSDYDDDAVPPESFDWRNKDGQNFLDSVITQGDCGSCYTISTVRMLSARNKIRQNNPNAASFSISFPLYCSEYNQGCDGGYGFLQSKWSEDVGLIPETCAPYQQSGRCSVAGGCDLGAKRYRASNHRYVGGYYGASDEDSIKHELMNGPVVMSFEPKEDFMYYKGGVYKSGQNQLHQEWEQVDHAVLLVGFGQDEGAGYWQLQNSWGTDWGENGYFRMARGIDESGCESIVVAAEVQEEASNSVLDDMLSQI
jgi:cathepsin C